MALAIRSHLVLRLSKPQHIIVTSKSYQKYCNARQFSTSPCLRSSRRAGGGPTRTSREDREDEEMKKQSREPARPQFVRPQFPDDLPADIQQEFRSLDRDDQERHRREIEAYLEESNSSKAQAEATYELQEARRNITRMQRQTTTKFPAFDEGLFATGESESSDIGPDDDQVAEGDEITSIGHMELDAHRDFRKYARVIAWEMPLLHNLRKPFEPPTEEHPLRFRYTTYMGEEHPAEKKVVVQLCVSDLNDLTTQQRDKLIKLAGSRYNPKTDIIKMSCESFATQAQNTRYLGDLVKNLVTEAKDPNDKMTDIPFDFRHHHPKPDYKFPEAWNLTPERRAQLQAKRPSEASVLQDRLDQHMLLDDLGSMSDEEILRAARESASAQQVPEEVVVPK